MRVVLPTYISRIPDCGWGHIVWLAGVAGMRSSAAEVFYVWVPTQMSQFATQLVSNEIEQRSHECNRAHNTRARENKLWTTPVDAHDDQKHVQSMRGHTRAIDDR